MNVEIWLSDEIPTLEAAKKFSGVKLLGNFLGPGTFGEENVVGREKKFENKSGRYLIVLVSEGKQEGMIFNLREVSANDITCSQHVA